MLETVKNYIANLPTTSFSDYYQDYVASFQHRSVNHQIEVDSHKFKSIDDIETVLKGLNTLTEELKRI